MLTKFILAVCISVAVSETIDCTGQHRYSATGTGYYPADDPIEGGFLDRQGHPLHTLQDFLDGKASWVSVAMDRYLHLPYGTHVCIPELNHKYHRVIPFRVVDTGSAFSHKGYGRIDICTRSQHDSYDNTINGHITLVFH
ncbi:uncharacterized protein [Mytilus edulis]|uniref:3D domain-containing protein n=2 Tax=Mytilus galloprovincialis TaxID=29158 RepID=A0A8B6HGF5_MYTGA|nr:Hypothetical predicted protein [Mytilus galloprovincialis]